MFKQKVEAQILNFLGCLALIIMLQFGGIPIPEAKPLRYQVEQAVWIIGRPPVV